MAEENGGYDPHAFNSTGIVWKHTVQIFEAIGLAEGAGILGVASGRIGGAAHELLERQRQLDRANADFENLGGDIGSSLWNGLSLGECV